MKPFMPVMAVALMIVAACGGRPQSLMTTVHSTNHMALAMPDSFAFGGARDRLLVEQTPLGYHL